jgi:hypothetical protein
LQIIYELCDVNNSEDGGDADDFIVRETDLKMGKF